MNTNININEEGRDKKREGYIKRNGIKLIPGASDYGVNIKGNVFNVKRMKQLKACPNGWAGYRQCSIIYDDGRRICKTVHRLVWITFNGDIPHGLEIGHIDGRKSNNALSNLELTTRSLNTRDPRRAEKMRESLKHGTSLRIKYSKKVKNPMNEELRLRHQ